MLNYKVLIKLCWVAWNTAQTADNSTTSARIVSPCTRHVNTKLSTNNFINILFYFFFFIF